MLEQVRDVVLLADQQRGVSVGELVDGRVATRSPLELIDAQDADGSAVRDGDREGGVPVACEVLLCLFEGRF